SFRVINYLVYDPCCRARSVGAGFAASSLDDAAPACQGAGSREGGRGPRHGTARPDPLRCRPGSAGADPDAPTQPTDLEAVAVYPQPQPRRPRPAVLLDGDAKILGNPNSPMPQEGGGIRGQQTQGFLVASSSSSRTSRKRRSPKRPFTPSM